MNANTSAAIPARDSIIVSGLKYVDTIDMPSFRLLRSYTVNGVILLESMTPLIMPSASHMSDSMHMANTRRLNSSASDMTAKISSTLHSDTSGLCTRNSTPWISECLARVSIIRSRTIAVTNSNTT